MNAHRSILLLLALPLQALALSGSDPARLADGLFARGMFELALREYTAVAVQPGVTNLDAVLYRMAESQRELGQSAAAEVSYDRVATGFPASVYAQRAVLRLAEASVNGGRFDAAAALLAPRDESGVDVALRPAWRYYRAYAERRAGRSAAAEPVFRRLLKEDAASPYAVFARMELAELIQAREPAAPEIATLLAAVAREAAGQPAGIQAALRLAAYHYDQGAFAAAAGVYQQLMQDAPAEAAAVRLPAAWSNFRAARWAETLALVAAGDGPDDLYLRANSLRQLGRAPEARSAYALLLERHPDHARAAAGRYEAAALALREGDAEAALDLAARVKPTPELAEDLLWILAEAARGAGQPARALAAYDQLAREHPAGARAAAARFQAARLEQDAGAWENASRRYRELATALPAAPLAPEAWFASAYCRIQLGQKEQAVDDWSRLIKDHPAFRAVDEALYGRAQAEFELGRMAAARASVERLLKDHAKSRWAPEAHYLLGTLLEREEDWELSEFHYRLAARGSRDPALARKIEFRRVAVLQRQGRNDEAAAALNEWLKGATAAEAVPPQLLDWVGRWNLQQQKWAEAERAGVKLAAQGGAWAVVGWYQAGRAREELGQRDEARAAFRQAAQGPATREAVESAWRLGRLAVAAEDWAEGRASFSRAAEQAADESMADLRARSYFGLAELAQRAGELDEAARTYLGVALLYDDPELTPAALQRAGEVLRKQGRAREADQTEAELRERFPDYGSSSKTTR